MPTSFLVCRPEFIGLWFGLKVAGNWDVWTKKEGRPIFQVFLILPGGVALQAVYEFRINPPDGAGLLCAAPFPPSCDGTGDAFREIAPADPCLDKAEVISFRRPCLLVGHLE